MAVTDLQCSMCSAAATGWDMVFTEVPTGGRWVMRGPVCAGHHTRRFTERRVPVAV